MRLPGSAPYPTWKPKVVLHWPSPRPLRRLDQPWSVLTSELQSTEKWAMFCGTQVCRARNSWTHCLKAEQEVRGHFGLCLGAFDFLGRTSWGLGISPAPRCSSRAHGSCCSDCVGSHTSAELTAGAFPRSMGGGYNWSNRRYSNHRRNYYDCTISLRCDPMTMCSRTLRHRDVNDLFNDATASMDNVISCDLA